MASTRTPPREPSSTARPASPAVATVLVAHRPADDDIGRRAAPPPAFRRRAVRSRRWLAGAALTLLLALAFTSGVVAVVAGLSGWRAMTVRSASMAPTLRDGDLIVVGPVRAGAVRAGQVVTFRNPHQGNTVLTQRVVSVRLVGGVDRFETRGDAPGSVERWTIAPNGLLGREVMAIPAIGGLLDDVASPDGLRGAAVAASALLLIWGSGRLMRGRGRPAPSRRRRSLPKWR